MNTFKFKRGHLLSTIVNGFERLWADKTSTLSPMYEAELDVPQCQSMKNPSHVGSFEEYK